ncbi:MAG: hypothetical protein AVDCRST_MAG47-1734, partial [uncultured Nocardioidaceae bacterium]
AQGNGGRQCLVDQEGGGDAQRRPPRGRGRERHPDGGVRRARQRHRRARARRHRFGGRRVLPTTASARGCAGHRFHRRVRRL